MKIIQMENIGKNGIGYVPVWKSMRLSTLKVFNHCRNLRWYLARGNIENALSFLY